LKNNSLLG